MDILYKELKDEARTLMPTLGYEISTPDVRVVDGAVAAGYRHVICECSSQHAAILNRLLSRWAKRVPRNQLFITLKINISNGSRVGYHQQFHQVLTDMECGGQADLLLLHNNMADRYTSVQLNSAWQLVEKLHSEGHVRCIGVSNFTQKEVTEILSLATKPPHVIMQEHFRGRESGEDGHLNKLCRFAGFCRYNKMCLLLKLAQLSSSELPKATPSLESLSKKHQVTCNQVLIRWLLQQEIGVIWQGTDINHTATNFKVFDFDLEHADSKALADAEAQVWTV